MNHEHITPLVGLPSVGPAPKPSSPTSPLRRERQDDTAPPVRAATRSVRAGVEHDQHHGAVMPPLHLSSNFTFKSLGEKRQYDYTRSGNPTRDVLAEALAHLEGGSAGLATCSGMSAVHLALQLVRPGGVVVAPLDCYGGTFRILQSCADRGQFEVRFVDQSDLGVLDSELADADLLWIETPSNPLLRVVDIVAATGCARRSGVLTVVDNTFLSPARQRPLQLGADVVVHSTTKYINGHSDVVGGAVIAKDPAVAEQLAFWCNCLGLSASPFDSYQCLRGLRTLEARWRIHDENASAVVALLTGHPAVRAVYHSSLKDHPGHQIARSQQSSHGAMVSFELHGNDAHVVAFLDGLRFFSLAESLGGVESLVAHPATMTHAVLSPEDLELAGISHQLLRLSVGLEAVEDLIRDLRCGLDRASSTSAQQPPSRSTCG